MVIFLLAQLGSLAAAASIPKVIQYIIDGPITHHDFGHLVRFAGLLALIAGLEFALILLRRYFSGVASLHMETDLRNDLYAHLQSLQVSFHDNWQSGQLLSRAIGDINTVRRFVGFGLIFAIVFVVQFGAVVFMLFRLDLLLAAVTALMALPVAAISRH